MHYHSLIGINGILNVFATENMETMSEALRITKDAIKKIQGKLCNVIKENNTILMYSF